MSDITGASAHKGYAKEGKLARTASAHALGRSSSPSDDSSTDLSDGGIRLDTLAITGYTPPHARPGFGGLKVPKKVRLGIDQSPKFEIGTKPSGDVFLSPTRAFQIRRKERSEASLIMDKEDASPVTRSKLLGVSSGVTRSQTSEIGSIASRGKFSEATPVAARSRVLENSPIGILRSRSSNLTARHQVGVIDPQGIYPPTACVFVANLPEPKDDRALEAAVTREFSKYGTVFVKIRRDNHHMPFAFCQFTKDEDAKDAMVNGKGSLILGRPCRTEMVKANRTFIVYRCRRDAITTQEVRLLAEPFGPLKKCEYLHPQLQEMLELPPTVIVEFQSFDPNRDLHAAFQYSEDYCVDAFDLKKNGYNKPRNNADEAFLSQYEVDRRSVFVGGLPCDTTEDELKELFSNVGDVVSAQVIRKSSSTNQRLFAFLEFSRPDATDLAIRTRHDTLVGDCRIRVERKQSREPAQTPRRVQSMFSSSFFHSPRDRIFPTAPLTPGACDNSPRETPTAAHSPIPAAPPPTPHPHGWTYGAQPFVAMPGSQTFTGMPGGGQTFPAMPGGQTFPTMPGGQTFPAMPGGQTFPGMPGTQVFPAMPGAGPPFGPQMGPGTPQSPFFPSPGMWPPGMVYMTDPNTGLGYFNYPSPAQAMTVGHPAQGEPAVTPTRATQPPTDDPQPSESTDKTNNH